MKKIGLWIFLFLFPLVAAAKESNITNSCNILVNGNKYAKITDDKYTTYSNFTTNDNIEISCEEDISYVYIYYNIKASKGILNENMKIGENGYLHELIKLEKKNKIVNIKYTEDYSIAEIYIFSEQVPEWVEDWQTLDDADLMLFSAHADDEQLFFAGLMPTYIDRGKKIQVIYFTNHYNNTNRYHEQLEGLWAIGVKYYPIISTFPDAYSESLDGAIKNLNNAGFKEEDGLKYEVEQIRRFKPEVVVSHDEKGEYSHGQHILTTYLIKDAIIKASDNTYDDNSYQKYGTWDISKLYLHLYPEKQIVLDYDIPLESYDGKTAYEVAKKGYAKHYSQQYTWFTAWLNGNNNEYTSATQIKTYNPAQYGLYYTNVGDDVNHNDMFENIKEKKVATTIIDVTKDAMKNVKNMVQTKDIKIYYYIGGIIGIIFIFMIIFRKKSK